MQLSRPARSDTQSQLARMAARSGRQNDRSAQYARFFMSLAIMTEVHGSRVCGLLPPGVRFCATRCGALYPPNPTPCNQFTMPLRVPVVCAVVCAVVSASASSPTTTHCGSLPLSGQCGGKDFRVEIEWRSDPAVLRDRPASITITPPTLDAQGNAYSNPCPSYTLINTESAAWPSPYTETMVDSGFAR